MVDESAEKDNESTQIESVECRSETDSEGQSMRA